MKKATKTTTRSKPAPRNGGGKKGGDISEMVADMKRRAVLQHDPVSMDILAKHGLAPDAEEAAKISATP